VVTFAEQVWSLPNERHQRVPDDVWTTLARVHAHWLRRRPRGLPVVDARWWRHLCLRRILPHLVAAGERTGDAVFAGAAGALRGWVDEPRDPHRGNVLGTGDGCVLIDWGNARDAPAGQDLAVLRAQRAADETRPTGGRSPS
jgi:hypothetical protein